MDTSRKPTISPAGELDSALCGLPLTYMEIFAQTYLKADMGRRACLKLTHVHTQTHLYADALRFVQVPWVKLMTEIYFLNDSSLAIGQVHASDAIFKQDRAGKSAQANKRSERYLIEIFSSSVEALASRLQNLDASQYADEPELLNGVPDAEDADLGIHFQLVVEVVAASNALFSRFDTFVLAEHAASVKRQSQSLRNGAVILVMLKVLCAT